MITNEERSALEVSEFCANPPARYVLYIKEPDGGITNQGIPWDHNWDGVATTWMGEKLGTVSFGRSFRSNFHDTRIPVRVRAINGLNYHGTYYRSAGDYARITLSR